MRRAEAGNYGDFGHKSGRKEEGAGGAAEQEGREDAAGSEILPRTGKKKPRIPRNHAAKRIIPIFDRF
jgi:hypothetical protein